MGPRHTGPSSAVEGNLPLWAYSFWCFYRLGKCLPPLLFSRTRTPFQKGWSPYSFNINYWDPLCHGTVAGGASLGIHYRLSQEMAESLTKTGNACSTLRATGLISRSCPPQSKGIRPPHSLSGRNVFIPQGRVLLLH